MITHHNTKLKCIVNPVLRWIQFWTDRPYVIFSRFLVINGEPKHFLRYGFGRIKYKEK